MSTKKNKQETEKLQVLKVKESKHLKKIKALPPEMIAKALRNWIMEER